MWFGIENVRVVAIDAKGSRLFWVVLANSSSSAAACLLLSTIHSGCVAAAADALGGVEAASKVASTPAVTLARIIMCLLGSS